MRPGLTRGEEGFRVWTTARGRPPAPPPGTLRAATATGWRLSRLRSESAGAHDAHLASASSAEVRDCELRDPTPGPAQCRGTCRSRPYASETRASSEVPRLDDLGGSGSLLGLLAVELMHVPDHPQPQGAGAEDPRGQLGQGPQWHACRCDIEGSAYVHTTLKRTLCREY